MKNPQKFVAFLRGVNVNETSMKMAELCEVFLKSGCEEVMSVLATGNIIFKSDLDKNILKEKLERSLSDHFQYEAFLFLKNAEEVNGISVKNPFEKDLDFHVYIFINVKDFEIELLQNFNETENTEGEDAKIIDENFYWKVKKGLTLDSNFGKILGKKLFKDSLTSRNINTIEKIIAKF
ncbi:DUF1697 domain-containing protein [Halpernia frigidisoli]|uniref:Uncharacterized conserved protein, DUF1697 family n=1 Tax=Halpernia frigidisoli TaxID=1125876 RepID=A0A1I3E3K7_9FLAO|nr:DUF1697 domain-containing protein [Halpernia frigidisoli]SFH93449.1 Uncharacterized conserved protein, DUF1697 family [Halpernia frigidisoli]